MQENRVKLGAFGLYQVLLQFEGIEERPVAIPIQLLKSMTGVKVDRFYSLIKQLENAEYIRITEKQRVTTNSGAIACYHIQCLVPQPLKLPARAVTCLGDVVTLDGLGLLASFYNSGAEFVQIPFRKLMKVTKSSSESLQIIVNSLVQKGFLEKHTTVRNTRNSYRVVIRELAMDEWTNLPHTAREIYRHSVEEGTEEYLEFILANPLIEVVDGLHSDKREEIIEVANLLAVSPQVEHIDKKYVEGMVKFNSVQVNGTRKVLKRLQMLDEQQRIKDKVGIASLYFLLLLSKAEHHMPILVVDASELPQFVGDFYVTSLEKVLEESNKVKISYEKKNNSEE